MVVVTGMSATDILRKDRDNGPVAADVIVIGGLAEAGLASRDQRFDRERTVAARRTTVNDEQFDCGMLEFFHHTHGLSVHTTLNDVRTEDRRNDGCDDLKDFLTG